MKKVKILVFLAMMLIGSMRCEAYCVYFATYNTAFYGGPEFHFWQQCSYGSGWLNPVKLW